MTREERELAQLWLEQKYPDSGTTTGREAGKSRDADLSRHIGYREGKTFACISLSAGMSSGSWGEAYDG
jgi:hypothetical protein